MLKKFTDNVEKKFKILEFEPLELVAIHEACEKILRKINQKEFNGKELTDEEIDQHWIYSSIYLKIEAWHKMTAGNRTK